MSAAPPSAAQILQDAGDFSLVQGGPLFQLLRRAHLRDDTLQLLRRRVVVIALLTWLPLLLLSAARGQLFGNGVAVSFLRDIETHIRFLVVVPLLLVAEFVVHQRLLPLPRAFLERNLIPEASMPRFDAAIRAAFRWRNSVVAELLLLVLVYTVGILIVWHQHTALRADTWYVAAGGGEALSPAGMWYACVSLPAFQFLLLRWYYRLLIWARFLWQVSRIRLNLVPVHPDALGGLGLLTNTVYAFTVLLVAHGAMVAAQIANRVLLLGASLPDFKLEIATVLAFLGCIVLGPLLLFSPQLARAKRTGLLEYGTFSEGYVRQFDHKWLRGGASAEEALLGSADIQSLADLSNSFAVVRAMRIAPITKYTLLQFAIAVLAPIAPLLATMMPLEALLQKLLGLVF
jgi:hypothetical protein